MIGERLGWARAVLIGALGCSGQRDEETEDARPTPEDPGVGGLATGEAGGKGGSGGNGATFQPSDATSYADCRYPGSNGGADAVTCHYVSVEFSRSLPAEGVEVELTTSKGDHLGPTSASTGTDFSSYSPALFVDLNAEGSEALGFSIRMLAGQDYSPEWISATVREGGATVAESRLDLTYSCVALTSDDWCWMAKPMELVVTPP